MNLKGLIKVPSRAFFINKQLDRGDLHCLKDLIEAKASKGHSNTTENAEKEEKTQQKKTGTTAAKTKP